MGFPVDSKGDNKEPHSFRHKGLNSASNHVCLHAIVELHVRALTAVPAEFLWFPGTHIKVSQNLSEPWELYQAGHTG